MGINIKDPSNNNILLDAPSANTFTISSSATERLRINSSGNVGIGTSNPSTLLHVSSSSSSTTPVTISAAPNQTANILNITNSDTSLVMAVRPNGSFRKELMLDSTDQRLVLGAYWEGGVGQFSYINATNDAETASTALVFMTGGTERTRIDTNGNFIVNNSSVFLITADGRIAANVNSVADAFNYTQSHISGTNSAIRALNSSYSGSVGYISATRPNNSAYTFLTCTSSDFSDVEFRFRGDGNAFADGTWSAGGADYAEYFEWLDGNPNNEDRRGIVVTLEGDKIKPAEEGDIIIGAISGNPSVIGDAAWNKWHEKYLRDDYGTYIFEDYEVLQWIDEEGNERAVDADGPDAYDAPENATVVVQQRRKINPAYDPDVEYISREDRPEWDCVGLMGKLRIRRGQPVKDSWIKMKDVSDTVEEWLVV